MIKLMSAVLLGLATLRVQPGSMGHWPGLSNWGCRRFGPPEAANGGCRKGGGAEARLRAEAFTDRTASPAGAGGRGRILENSPLRLCASALLSLCPFVFLCALCVSVVSLCFLLQVLQDCGGNLIPGFQR